MPISVMYKIWDITFFPSYKNTIPGVLGTQNDIMKQDGVSLSHGGLVLLSSLTNLKVLPLQFQLDYSALQELHLSLVQNMSRLRGKLPIRFHL